MTPKTPISPKAIAGALGALVPGIILALLLGLQSDPTTIAGLPSWLQGLIVALLPAVIAYLAAYQKRDPLRDSGAIYEGLSPQNPLPHEEGSAPILLLLFVTALAVGIALPVLILPGLVLCAMVFAVAAANQHRQIREVVGSER